MKIISFDIGIKNMAYCIASIDDNHLNLISLNKCDLNISNKSTIQNLIENTIEFLDDIFHNQLNFNSNDTLKVLIECQMTSKMKCIQTTINTYFKMISKTENLNIDTIYLSPKHKLDLTKKYPLYSYIDNNNINNYKNNKINSVNFSLYLLNNFFINNNFINIISNQKKKDDLCDALLMVLFYFQK